MIDALFNYLDNAIHHKLLSYSTANIKVFGKILIHPNLHYTILVDPDVLLLHWEKSNVVCKLAKPFQALRVNMKKIRKWNVLNIWEPDGYFLDE